MAKAEIKLGGNQMLRYSNNRLIMYDFVTSSGYNTESYDPECLEHVSGDFRRGYINTGDIVFKSKVKGTLNIIRLRGSNMSTLTVNGTVIPYATSASVPIEVGDVIEWKSVLYYELCMLTYTK